MKKIMNIVNEYLEKRYSQNYCNLSSINKSKKIKNINLLRNKTDVLSILT